MNKFSKVKLGIFPTPLYRLDNISNDLGTNVWIKRDDMCGVALGGNKVRKLEYLLADAKNKSCELIMTTGQAQSNHAMLTAACAFKLNMDCILVLKKRGVTDIKGNQILNRLMGARVVYVDTDSYDEIYDYMDTLTEGRRAYKIPCGGSNPLGSLGYVDCMREISLSGVSFDHIVCACGSGGTAAGVYLGARLFLPGAQVHAAAVDTDPFDKIVPDIMKGAAHLLDTDVALPNVELINMCGPGYSIPSSEGNAAISLMLRREGIVLDSCYTGKAFAGLIKLARAGCFKQTDNVLFIHTGGAGGLFAQSWDDFAFEL